MASSAALVLPIGARMRTTVDGKPATVAARDSRIDGRRKLTLGFEEDDDG